MKTQQKQSLHLITILNNVTYDADDDVNTQTSSLDTARTNGTLESIYLNNLNDENANPGLYDFDSDIYNSRIGARYGLNTETANFNPTFNYSAFTRVCLK